MFGATLAGFAFHLTSLAMPLTSRDEIEPPALLASLRIGTLLKGFGIMVAGQALMSFVGIIDQFFAAHLGTGAIVTLSYAKSILALILGPGATAVSRATLPRLFKDRGKRGRAGASSASHWVRLLFTFGVLALLVGWELTPWAVRLLFERGAFTAKNTFAVSEVLRVGLLQLPFYFAGLVMV